MRLFIFVLLMLFSSCRINAIEPVLLAIPTPEGSGQAVHPDILKMPAGSGYKYCLAFTPFPFSQDKYENPCLAFSDDGLAFNVNGVNNPVISEQYTKDGMLIYNNDPDIFYDESKKMYYLTLQNTHKDHSDQNIDIYESPDLKNWSIIKNINEKDILKDNFSLSPSLVKEHDQYYLFFVNLSQNYEVRYLKKKALSEFDYKDQNKTTLNMPGRYKPWHIDVFKGDDSKYYMLICAFEQGKWQEMDLFLAESNNLVDWLVKKEPVLKHGEKFFNAQKIYRSSGVVENDVLKVWFSIQTYRNEWRIGYYESMDWR